MNIKVGAGLCTLVRVKAVKDAPDFRLSNERGCRSDLRMGGLVIFTIEEKKCRLDLIL